MKIIIIVLLSLLLVGCTADYGNNVIHSGIVESVYTQDIAVNGKFFGNVCRTTLKDISVGDQVNIYRSNRFGCSYIISKTTNRGITFTTHN